MALILIREPMDTSQFIFGSTTAPTAFSVIPGGIAVDFGAELQLRFFGGTLAFTGLEPTGGNVLDIAAYRGAQLLGTLETSAGWDFTRAGLIGGYAGEAHSIADSAGFDILRGGDLGDVIVVDGAEDWVRAGAGDDRIILDRTGSGTNPLPPVDLDGEAGTDTLEIKGDIFTAIVDLRGITLAGVENLALGNRLAVRVGQTQAEGFADIRTNGTNAFLLVHQDQAVLDLNLLNYLGADGVTLIGVAPVTGGTIIAKSGFGAILQGAAGADQLQGDSQTDSLQGGAGSDNLNGGGGRDSLEGGAGRDTLNGGRGDDVMDGNGGRDLFAFDRRSGVDEIDDFRAYGRNRDRIDLTGIDGITGFRDLMRNHLVVDGADLTLQLGRGASVELRGVARADLDLGDFLFGG